MCGAKSSGIIYCSASFSEFPSFADYADPRESASTSSENSESWKHTQDKRNTTYYHNEKFRASSEEQKHWYQDL